MKLTVLGSSSSGNCYLIHNENECLIVECGVRLSEVKEALNFNISIIVGALVSHAHNDHAGYLESYARAGIRILTSEDVLNKKNDLVTSTLCKVVEPGKGYKLGNFKIIPFGLQHDIPCLGYLIDHPETGLIVFITDSFLSEYTFEGVSHWIIEANYADDILEDNIIYGRLHPSMRPRLLQTHMELNTCKSILLANDMNKVINIILVHLSSGNSDALRFKKEITEITGKQVFIADKNLTIDMNKIPY
jgi:phosphoribosyl 1,2-cyclic phosphodiesterase